MSRRPTLRDLRRALLHGLDGQWRCPSDFVWRLGLDYGPDWYRVCLILERLANDGAAEIRIRGNRRKFRRAA